MKKLLNCILLLLICCGCSQDKTTSLNNNYEIDVNSNLPVIYIESNKIKTEPSLAKMVIYNPIGNELGNQLFSGDIEIKIRGNLTSYRAKRPYKIKLANKANLFGMGKSKHWVLLANDLDHTQIRNHITLDFARSIGMKNTSQSKLVTLILNGEYQGVYELAEHVGVGSSRVDIYDWQDTFSSIDGKNIIVKHLEDVKTRVPQTGGFLLEGDYYNLEGYIEGNEYDEEVIKDKEKMISNIFTDWYMPFKFNSPEYVYPDTKLYQYTYNYIQSFEYALHSPDFTYHANDEHYKPINMSSYVDDDKRVHWNYDLKESNYHNDQFDGYKYTDFFDLDSLVNYFLINEITMNWDGMKNSLFIYKDTNNKAYIGPAWDYDLAYGNVNDDNVDYIVDTWKNLDGRFFSDYDLHFYLSAQWYVELCKNKEFLDAVYEKFWKIRDNEIQGLIDSVDEYKVKLRYDCKKNDELWGDRYSLRANDENPDYDNCFSDYTGLEYDYAYVFLKRFLTDRVAWLDEQMSSKEKFYDSINEALSLLK